MAPRRSISPRASRLGILNRTEFRLAVPNHSEGVAGAELHSGFCDLSPGLKRQIGPLPGNFDLAVIIAGSFPTGRSCITSGGYDPFIKFPWSKELKAGWSVGGQQSLFWNTDGDRRNGVWEPMEYLENNSRSRFGAAY